MNNDQFRRLVQTQPGKSPGADTSRTSTSSSSLASPMTARASGGVLGSRAKPSIPMTPRSVAGRHDFVRQVAELSGKETNSKNAKGRLSAPKGSRLAPGYVDRAQTRQQDGEEDERLVRLKALEEAFKKEEVDRDTFDRLRSEIAGGDLSSTHLVKGLDFKLLERIRRGEDVLNGKPAEQHCDKTDTEEQREQAPEDVDDELEKLASADVQAVAKKDRAQKKGQVAAAADMLNPGQKRTRNQILAELKAARAAARAKAESESALGSRFKKIGAKREPGTRIEMDAKGREVIIIVDADGHERRKVRKLDTRALREREREKQAFVPDKNQEALGMEVPEVYRKQQEEREKAAREAEDDDDFKIFGDAGSDYDPLADLQEDSDGGSHDELETDGKVKPGPGEQSEEDKLSMPPPPRPKAPMADLFKDSKTKLVSEEEYKPVDNAAFLAALKKAKAIGASDEERKEDERQQRLKKMLEATVRDDEDMDMGFGSSRVEDEAEAEASDVKLSTWSGGGDDQDGDEHRGRGAKRKRGPKKRKGDKDSFADVMKVMERQKGEKAG